jgi:CysZ protein
MKFVWEHRGRLVALVLPPMMICLAIIVLAMIVIVQGVPSIVDRFWSEPSLDAWWGAKHFLWQWLELPVAIFLGMAASLAALLVAFVLFSLLTAAFCDALSEKVEVLRGTFEPQPFSWAFFAQDILQSLRLELAHVGLKLLWLFPLFVASLVIPVVGPVVYVVGGGYLLARRTGMDYLDWCGARRGWDYRRRLEFMRRHRPAVLGFGACVLLAWALPFAFVILWPAAVAGGAILFSELQGEQ